MSSTFIISAKRTPIGAFLGSLSTFTAPQLGSIAIKAAIDAAGLPLDAVSEVIMGNVLTAGIGQAPARQAALGAGLPDSVPCMTINKVCGSGLKAVMLADQAIRCGDAEIVIAGGQESMTNAPYLLPKGRTGYRYGNGQVIDSMQYDGLTDAYQFQPMGDFAEICASDCNITRSMQDEYAIMSYQRAIEAQKSGAFTNEIVPVLIQDKKGTISIDSDEEPGKVRFDKIPDLKPVFKKDGTITAANASSIDDGAAAIVLASQSAVQKHGLHPIARIVAQVSFAHKPQDFNTAPIEAIKKVLEKAHLTIEQIDLFEVNEAFAVTALSAKNQLDIPLEKMNINGGAIALGHPIGASGARVFTTLLHALKNNNKKYGLATLCIGGGEASAVIVEAL
ncbi:MAG: thiolase family protein [Bacteroidota bacterium]|jgi:acetyl-CoA C-acetyltransferase